MKSKLLFLASVVTCMALALVGVMNDVGTLHAAVPTPIQPFAPLALDGVSTTRLGDSITLSSTKNQVLEGQRTATGWGFTGPGYSVDLDKELFPDGAKVGTVSANIDVNCDGSVDGLYDDCTAQTPLPLNEATTVVQGTPDAFLIPIMPPFPWLTRHKAAIAHVCIGTNPIDSPADLNTIYAAIPFSPNGAPA